MACGSGRIRFKGGRLHNTTNYSTLLLQYCRTLKEIHQAMWSH